MTAFIASEKEIQNDMWEKGKKFTKNLKKIALAKKKLSQTKVRWLTFTDLFVFWDKMNVSVELVKSNVKKPRRFTITSWTMTMTRYRSA